MDISETKIYKHLNNKDNTFYCANINNVAAYAQSFLSRIPAMFSNYTNHDIGHSARVADYMVDLLPQPLDKYNDTELVIMLYSAIFHDIGMVVSETESDLDSARQDDIRKTHHIRSENFFSLWKNLDFGCRIIQKEEHKRPWSEQWRFVCLRGKQSGTLYRPRWK